VAAIEPAWRAWPSGTQQRLGSRARSLRPLGAPPKRSFPGSPMGKRPGRVRCRGRKAPSRDRERRECLATASRPWLWRFIRLPARSRPSRSAEKGRGAGIHGAVGAGGHKCETSGRRCRARVPAMGRHVGVEGRPGHRCIGRHVDRQRRAWAVGQADCAVTRSGHR